MLPAPMLAELHNVTKSYRSDANPVPVLNGIELRIEPGETIAIVGPSGCGKSTLLNLLGALDQPDSGEVRVADKNLRTSTRTNSPSIATPPSASSFNSTTSCRNALCWRTSSSRHSCGKA